MAIGDCRLSIGQCAGVVVLLLAPVGALSAPNLAWRFEFAPTYVDNVFEYSPADLDSFLHGVNPERFAARSSDDLDASVGLGCALHWRLGGRPGSAGLRTRFHGFVSNWEKSYGLAAFELEQAAWRGGEVRLSYLFLPDYLIRSYRVAGGGADYVPCRFAEHLVSARVEQRLGNFSAAALVRHESDDYTAAFDYYDTWAWRLGPELGWRLRENLKVSGSYEYKLAAARGPAPDISYTQHGIGVRVDTRPMSFDRFGVVAHYDYARREFTTANPVSVDPAHAGRVDDISRAGVELRWRQGGATFSLGYEAEWRSVLAASSYEIDDVKEYRKNSIGLGVALSSRSAR